MKTKTSTLVTCLAVALLAGCAGTPAHQQAAASQKIVQRSAADVQTNSVVQKDRYAGTLSVRSPSLDYSGGTHVSLIYTQPKDDGPVLYSVAVDQYRSEWLFLNQAISSTGNKLPFTLLDRNVVRGGVSELVAIDFTRADLDNAITTGIDFKLYGQRGNVEVYVPKNYVAGFLAAVDAARK